MSRALIVDDKDNNLHYLRALLEGHGWEVDTARDGVEALSQARQDRPTLVISDLLMPVMDGFALLSEWRSDPTLSDVAFIVYTATYVDAEDERLALSLGADAFIVKPTEPDEFMACIHRVLERSSIGSAIDPAALSGERGDLLALYNQTLVRRLEHKSLQLAETNSALQHELAEQRRVELQLQRSERELRQLSHELQEERARLLAAQRVGKIGSWETDIHTLDVIWSEETHRIHGTDPATFKPTHRGYLELVHPDDREELNREFFASLTRSDDSLLTHRIVRSDGEIRVVEERWQVLRDLHGEPLRTLGTCRDITESRLAEAELRRSTELLRAVADNVPDAVFIKDEEGRYLLFNQGAALLVGLPVEHVLGKDDTLIFGEAGARITRENDLQVMRSGEARTTEEVLTAAGATRTYLAMKVPYRDGQGKVIGVIGISRDISERRRLEQQDLRSQRMESIGTLAGGIAHDLNNVLTPIMMSIDLLKQNEHDRLRLDVLATIEGSAKRGADLVRQVLSFARGVEGQRLEVQLGRLLHEVGEIARKTFPKSITTTVVAPDDLWTIDGDSTQLHQVLLNMCVNARDAMPNGGILKLSASNHTVEEHDSTGNRHAELGRHVRIQIEDTGTGMSPEIIERIFEPFFTTKEFGAGTGLGLSTTLAIIKSHRGFVRVHSEVGKGSRFEVFLQASTRNPVAVQIPEAADLPRGKGETVLVIDDEASVRQVTGQTLEAFGYRVLLAADGAEASSIYAVQQREIDVVLTDMMMPVMDGRTTIKVLTRINPAVRIIAMSGLVAQSGGLTAAAAAEVEGVTHFLDKPFTSEALLIAVRATLDEPRVSA